MSTGKIQVWLDCNSFYSRFALLHLRKYAKVLREHGIDYEVFPVFIAGLNQGSGNKPPWTLPAKAAYGSFDSDRARKYFGCAPMRAPDGFPHNTTLPMRAMCYIKHTCTRDLYETVFTDLWAAMFERNENLSKPDGLGKLLRQFFTEAETARIITAGQSQVWKDNLTQNTQRALDLGAFGAPWFWVRNGKGVEEPFFGSDRFHYMWDFLEIPHRDFEVLSSSAAKL